MKETFKPANNIWQFVHLPRRWIFPNYFCVPTLYFSLQLKCFFFLFPLFEMSVTVKKSGLRAELWPLTRVFLSYNMNHHGSSGQFEAEYMFSVERDLTGRVDVTSQRWKRCFYKETQIKQILSLHKGNLSIRKCSFELSISFMGKKTV